MRAGRIFSAMSARHARSRWQPTRMPITVALLTATLLLTGCASSVPTASPPHTGAPALTPAPTLAPTPTAPPTPEAIVAPPTLRATETPTASPTKEVTPAASPTEPSTPSPGSPASPTALPTSGPNLAISSVARAPADPAAAKTAASSINAFGLDLFRQLLADASLALAQKNTVFSPTSIALALAMARAGAKGETASQMDTVLHTTGWDALGPGLNSLDQVLESRNAMWQEDWLSPSTRHLTLRIANAAYAQRGWKIEQSYLDVLASAFGSGLHLADFISHATAAIAAINAWVSDQTAGRIPHILGPTDLNNLTRLVLVNAIYLKANWTKVDERDLFSASDTKAEPFTRPDGSSATVPMMAGFGGQAVPYASGTGWQAADLPYQGPRFTSPLAMTVILPDNLATFEAGLTASELSRITAALAVQRTALQQVTYSRTDVCEPGTYPYAVDLHLPRFGIETRADLPDLLKALGMPLAFDMDRADFTGIHVPENETDRLYVTKVIHQANIDVDEKGTEAAAATVVAMGTTGGCGGPNPGKTITLRLDHPFLFFVRDLETGAVLFMGQVTDPSAGKGG